MQRKSSIHFAPVTNIKFAVSHSERTELSEPGYLLPKEHQLDNVIVDGSLSENELAALFIKQKEAMTGQAKARGSSPFWEGVVVLGNTDAQEQSANLLDWKKSYEQTTGHKVLHMSIHLDEGYIDKAGNPQYNPHAHVIVSRMNKKNRVIELKRKQLGEVQNLTAETLQMERGSTLEERGGKRGRKHIPHAEFRLLANQKRLEVEKEKITKNNYANWLDYKIKEYDSKVEEVNILIAETARLNAEAAAAGLEKVKSQSDYQDLKVTHEKAVAELDGEPERLAAALAAQKIQLDEQYRQDRAALKASGKATQADYQQLKKDHEKEVADLKDALQERDDVKAQQTSLQTKLDEEPERQKAALAAQKIHLDEQYKQDRAALKASGEATQADYQQLKKDHEKAVADLTNAQTEAGKVPALAEQLRVSKEQITTVTQQAVELAAKVAQYQRDDAKAATTAEQAAVVTGLKADLAAARQLAKDALQERDGAKTTATTEQAAVVTGLKADLLEARQLAKDALQERDGAKATATAAQADKVLELEQQLKTTQQEAINTKLTADERYKKLHGQALEIQSERNELAKKVATLSVAPPAQPERRPTPAAPAQTPVSRHQTPAAPAQQPAARPALAPRPTPTPAPAVQVPAPAPAPTLAERLAESLQSLLEWIKGQGGVLKEINTEKADCYGAVVQLDDLHAVQRVGLGTYTIHRLDQLDKVLALDDPKTEISYRGGRGTVVCPGYGHGLGR
jgi:hypothetical protein